MFSLTFQVEPMYIFGTKLEVLFTYFMAPLFLILSARVLMNCLVLLMPYASQTEVCLPQKNWVIVAPSAVAGVSGKTVSVATASFYLGMLKTGFLALKCFLR